MVLTLVQGCASGVETAQAATAHPVQFELLLPSEGSSSEQLAAWTDLIKTAFANKRERGGPQTARLKLLEIETALATPAFINALHGLDMSNPEHVQFAARLTDFWLQRQVYVAMFAFRGNPEAMSPEDIESRLEMIALWADWWRKKAGTPGKISEYSKAVSLRWREIGEGTYSAKTGGR
ncbi:MAG: hypothetical protein ACT4PU_11535 [Planctomycetota bacterium]